MLTRRRVIAAKIESVEGTAESITVSDAGILAIDPKFDPEFKKNERSIALNTLSKLVPVMGTQSARLTFKAELKGPGAAYSSSVTPALGKYLRACGFAETIVTTSGSETATYKPASTGVPSLTIWCYEDGVIKKMKGCRGNVKFSGKNGEPCYAEFEFLGVYDGTVDGAIVSPTFEASVPPVLLSAILNLDAYAAIAASWSVDMGNDTQLREDFSAAAGFLSCLITDRRPTGKFDPEFVLVATHDFLGKWKAGTSIALTLGPVGATQYNKYTITAPKLVYTQVAEGDRTGLMVADTGFDLAMNSGDDEIQIVFS